VYSQTWKKFDRSRPEICSLRAMNSSVVAVSYLCWAAQVRRISKKGSSPIFSRRA